MSYICGLKRMFLAGLLVFCSVFTSKAQDEFERTMVALQQEGFADLRVATKDSVVVFTIQNEAYKQQATGIAAALRVLRDQGELEQKLVKVIVTDYGIPQVTLTYDPAVGDWKVSHRLEKESWKMVRYQPKRNSSFGKADIAVYPRVSLMNLIITQVYQSLWQLNPAFEVSLWPGSKISAQVDIPLFNDGYGAREDKVHPGMITFSQRFRVPGDVMGRFSAGLFSNNRHGLALDLSRRFSFNPRFWVQGSFALLGLNYWDGFHLHYDPKLQPFWNLGVGYYWPKGQTSFVLKVQKFLLEDYGVKFEMSHHFRYVSIGFYAEKGLNTYAKTNGGFRFSVALAPHKYKRYKYTYIPRITTAGQMGMTYNANNEQRWYKESKWEASDNIMNDNAFNPYYIKKEIDKLINN